MEIPAFFGAVATVELPRIDRTFGAALVEVENPPVMLAVTIPAQLATEWCWAAVATGIAKSLGPAPLTQCQLVERTIECVAGGCCRPPPAKPDPDCNRQWMLHDALAKQGYDYAMKKSVDERLTEQTLYAALRERGPVGALIQWPTSRGLVRHYIALTGMRMDPAGGAEVFYQDPMGPSAGWMSFSRLLAGFGHSSGKLFAYFIARQG